MTDDHHTLRVRALEVVDERGTVRARLTTRAGRGGGPSFELLDAKGEVAMAKARRTSGGA